MGSLCLSNLQLFSSLHSTDIRRVNFRPVFRPVISTSCFRRIAFGEMFLTSFPHTSIFMYVISEKGSIIVQIGQLQEFEDLKKSEIPHLFSIYWKTFFTVVYCEKAQTSILSRCEHLPVLIVQFESIQNFDTGWMRTPALENIRIKIICKKLNVGLQAEIFPPNKKTMGKILQ